MKVFSTSAHHPDQWYLESAKSDDAALHDESSAANWLTVVPLTLRRVAMTIAAPPSPGGAAPAPPAAALAQKFLPDVFELVGMSEENRRLLDDLLQQENGELLVSFAYPSADKKSWVSDDLSGDKATGCTVYRTNLGTESNPSPVAAFALAKAAPAADELAHVATIGQGRTFVRLVRDACLVNGGGYYLQYSANPVALPFDGENKLDVLIVIAGGKVSDAPVPRSYQRAVAWQAPASPAVSADSTLFLLAKLYVQMAGQETPIMDFHPRLALGVAGFHVERPRVPAAVPPNDPDYDRQIDQLFSRLSYGVVLPAAAPPNLFRSLDFTLPILPVQSVPADGSRAAGPPATWSWQHTIQYLSTDGDNLPDPYSAVGTSLAVTLGFRDPFGNEFPASGANAAVPLPIVYGDPLVPIGEWPGLTLALDSDLSSGLRIKLVFNPLNINLKDDATSWDYQAPQTPMTAEGVTPRQAAWAKNLAAYRTILRQLQDRRACAEAFLESTWAPTPDANPAPIDVMPTPSATGGGRIAGGQMRSAVASALALLERCVKDPFDPATTSWENVVVTAFFELGRPQFAWDKLPDFFPVRTRVRIRREGADNLFARDDSGVFEHCRSVTTEVRFPDRQPKQTTGLIEFCRGLEKLYADASVRVALGPSPDVAPAVPAAESGAGSSAAQVFFLQWQRLCPQRIREFPHGDDEAVLAFGLRPLSTSPVWRRLQGVLPQYPGTAASDQTFANVDIDAAARDLFRFLEGLLAPAVVDGWLTPPSAASGANSGRDLLQRLVGLEAHAGDLGSQPAGPDLREIARRTAGSALASPDAFARGIAPIVGARLSPGFSLGVRGDSVPFDDCASAEAWAG